MDNANSPEYLDKILSQVIENLKRTQHAPSVQMQDVPRSPMAAGMDDDADDAMDDEDADANPDVRYTQRQWDKFTSKVGELSESEDEEANDRLGVRRQPGQRRRRNIMDYQNPNAIADGIDSGAGTPVRSLNGESGRVTKNASPAPRRSRSRASSTKGATNGRTSAAARSTAASSRRSSAAPAEPAEPTEPAEKAEPVDEDVEMEQESTEAKPPNGTSRSPSAGPAEKQLTPPESPAAATETVAAAADTTAAEEPTAGNEDMEMADGEEQIVKKEE
jgi:histone deacetylase 1/2